MSITLTFHGAARAVTGSCFALHTQGGDILVDCGMFQGSKSEKELNYRAFPFAPSGLAAVILSHAHIDHSGLLPKLTKAGFAGPIYATPATRDLAGVMLPDSGYIQEMEVEQLNRRRVRRGEPPLAPIYTVDDAAATMPQFRVAGYGEWFEPVPGVRARFWNAGHLLGSASIEVEARGPGAEPIRILFSADIGPDYKLLHPDPTGPSGIDYLLCESTYGAVDRIDGSEEKRRGALRAEVLAARRPDGALLIPCFAVERAQELISDLHHLMRENRIPRIPIYIDSPLATRASEIFAKHAGELEAGADLVAGLRSHDVHFTESVEQSKALDRLHEFHIVIAASGMCEAGRIRHRLKNWLWREEATVLFVGYQAEGTLGRILRDGASKVRIQGSEIDVRARIRSLDLYSGHADGPELATWVKERMPIRHEVFLVHGEEPGMFGLKERLRSVLPADRVMMPELDQGFALTPTGARALAPREARIDRRQPGHPDWHNEVAKLYLEIEDSLAAAADARSRGVIVRRLRRALEKGTGDRD